ncbi:MAG TPA: bifunctional 3'-5' exonuclease/DNA polymerase [Micromonosporaceae bacterium]|jgi:DNA polymerase-1|nr:bifunctional 3'-5' exonuclease/DNA polymerase [Micromonosporaceae bacterium]
MVAVVPDGKGGARLREITDQGRPAGPERVCADLAAQVRARGDTVRWLWPATAEAYPALLRTGVWVDRCHDLELTEALLLGSAGRWGEPRALPAAWARLVGAPVPADPPARAATPPGDGQGALFDAPPAPPAPAGMDPLTALIDVYVDQRARIEQTPQPGRFRLLAAAESASALVAAEMGGYGLPWRADVHDRLLVELLGPPSPVGGPPRRLVELASRIAEAFGMDRLRLDSPAEVVRAFSRVGITIPNTRAWVLRGVDHPAVPLLLEYKELYRVWTAHGWAWRDAWVHDGRFRAEYIPGGVVSGRWATRGGGALQIPKVIRRAAIADPGWTFVVADAGQLEPRVLAAVSGDDRLAAAAAEGDLYSALAAEAFGGDRAKAKLALLGAMYGQTGGAAIPALAALRQFYPTAWEHVEQAARTGESGGLVRSWLGRTCPPPSVSWWAHDGEAAAARARGRFTRNFVIQATAAEWANTLLATLRTALHGTGAELVFFQHDEVLVHCEAAQAERVAGAVRAAGERARRLLFGGTPVRFPLDVSVVECYADAA